MESYKKGRIDADTTFKMQRQILTGKIEDEEFLESAIENFSEMTKYIVQGNLFIRIYRDITGLPDVLSRFSWLTHSCYLASHNSLVRSVRGIPCD